MYYNRLPDVRNEDLYRRARSGAPRTLSDWITPPPLKRIPERKTERPERLLLEGWGAYLHISAVNVVFDFDDRYRVPGWNNISLETTRNAMYILRRFMELLWYTTKKNSTHSSLSLFALVSRLLFNRLPALSTRHCRDLPCKMKDDISKMEEGIERLAPAHRGRSVIESPYPQRKNRAEDGSAGEAASERTEDTREAPMQHQPWSDFTAAKLLSNSVYLWACDEALPGEIGPSRSDAWVAWIVIIVREQLRGMVLQSRAG